MSARIAQTVHPVWHYVDANEQVVGRLATQVARLLMGKHKPTFVPNVDCGDFVVIVNAANARFTGRKATEKLYRWHTHHPGGLKTLTARQIVERAPERIVMEAVLGMMHKHNLRSQWAKKLRIFRDDRHPFTSHIVGSQRAAAAFLATTAPASMRIASRETLIDLETPATADSPAAENPVDLFKQRFAAEWDAEVAHWAAKGEVVPAEIYALHDVPFPGADKAPLDGRTAAAFAAGERK